MKPVLTPPEAIECLHTLNSGSWDQILNPRQITLKQGECSIQSSGGEGVRYSISDWAKSQLLSRLGIPVIYYERCPVVLQELQYSYWRDQLSARNTKFLVRGRGNLIRGILSSRYSIINDFTLIEAVEPLFVEGMVITFFEVTDNSFHLRLVSPRPVEESGHQDPLYCGVHVSNSEVGYRPVSIDSIVYREVCSNGLIRLHDQTNILRRRHIGTTPADFAYQVLQAARSAICLAEDTAESFLRSKYRPILNTVERVQYLGKKWELSKTFQQSIIDQISGEAYPETEYALINAITSVAQDLEPDNRYRMESLAGSLL